MNSESKPLASSDILLLRDRAISATQISILIVDAADPDLPIIDANPAFEHLTGYARHDVIGRNPRLLQGPDTDPATVAVLRDGIMNRQEVSVTILNYRKDGSAFWNDLHISPAYDEHHVLTHFVGVQSDVTERVHAERNRDLLVEATSVLNNVASQEEILARIARIVVPAIGDICIGYLTTDPHDDHAHAVTVVAREISQDLDAGTNPPLDSIQPVQIRDSLHGHGWVLETGETTWIPTILPEMLDEVNDVLAHAGIRRSVLGASLVMTPIASPSRIYGSLVVLSMAPEHILRKPDIDLLRDVGRRIGAAYDSLRLYEQAQEAIRARDAFLSSAAHEFRTPIVSIKGYAQFLMRSVQRETLTSERLQIALATIDSAVSRLATLTDDLISVSHRNLDHLPLHKEAVNMRSFLETFFASDGPASQKGYVSTTSLDSADTWISADLDRLHQVLTIILSNAVRFSPDESPIFVHAESDTAGVTVTITDLGLGLLAGEEQTIFEPFARTEEGIRGHLSGLGIGLFIARTIIERHEGRIWASSAGRSLGTSISFWLPSLAAEVSADQESDPLPIDQSDVTEQEMAAGQEMPEMIPHQHS
ncbi:MAG: ATP-binding protein [Thermomicrobiales bacterium]